MSWTAERIDLLTQLWSEGHSASRIALQLGGVTRNAVIGKVHRLKLEGRVKAAPADGAADEDAATEMVVEIVEVAAVAARIAVAGGAMRPQAVVHGATALQVEVERDGTGEPARGAVVPMSRNLTLVQLSERTCKWPIGDPRDEDFRFCGNHAADAAPYCAHHARIAFQPVSERRRVR